MAACVVALCGAVGCGAPTNVTNEPTTSNTSAHSQTTTAPASPVVTADDADDGHTITLQAGQRLRVTLPSTYWTLADSSDPNVLRTGSAPTVSPQPTGCVPGEGCGTVSAVYVAVAAGIAHLTASRTSCGEAMGCTGSSGSWSLTVVVR